MEHTERSLRMWTLYERPSDHPHHWVLRGATVVPGGFVQDATAYLFHRREKAEAWMAQEYPGLSFIGRSPDDDPVIVGVFL